MNEYSFTLQSNNIYLKIPKIIITLLSESNNFKYGREKRGKAPNFIYLPW